MEEDCLASLEPRTAVKMSPKEVFVCSGKSGRTGEPGYEGLLDLIGVRFRREALGRGEMEVRGEVVFEEDSGLWHSLKPRRALSRRAM